MLMDQMLLLILSCLGLVVAAESEVFGKSCAKFHIRKSTIIRTQQSVHNGAEFLGKKIVTSARGCHEQCCDKQECNLVMLKYDVKEVSCFMFNCRSPSVCSFYKHATYNSYAALEYEDRETSYSSNEYGKNNHFEDKHPVKLSTTETPLPPTTPTKAYKVNNLGNWFEKTTTMKPKYKSERKWLDEEVDKISTTHHSYDTSNTKDWVKTAPKVTAGYDFSQQETYHHHTKDINSNEPESTKSSNEEEEEEFPRRVFVDNNPDFPDDPQRHTERHTKKSAITKKPKTYLKNSEGATEMPATKPRVSNVVIRRLNIQENKAVIPLAIGLVLALLLLMAIIFRLKTSRRRRTKAFLTDDADYLINGMYL